jgi:hypothetical protein
MQPQFNDEGDVPVGVPGVRVLLPLACTHPHAPGLALLVVHQRHQRNNCQNSVPGTPILNPPNQTKTRVMQETVLVCARLL